MSSPIEQRVLALAGMIQALAQVRRIAETGQSDASAVQTLLDSVFRIDAETPEAVYGEVANLRPGLRLLRDYFNKQQGQDDGLPRLALSLVNMEGMRAVPLVRPHMLRSMGVIHRIGKTLAPASALFSQHLTEQIHAAA